MDQDGALRLLELHEDQEPRPAAGGRRTGTAAGPTLNVRVAGPNGVSLDLEVAVGDLPPNPTVQDVILLAADNGGDDISGDAQAVGSRQAFLNGLPDQLARVGDGGREGEMRYLLMAQEPDGSVRPVHPRAPVRLGEVNQGQYGVRFFLAPHHVGGR